MPAEAVKYYVVRDRGNVQLNAREHEGLLIPAPGQDELPNPLEVSGLRKVEGAVQPRNGDIVKVVGADRWILDARDDASEDWSMLEFTPGESELMTKIVEQFGDTFRDPRMSPLFNALRAPTRSDLLVDLKGLSNLPGGGKREVAEEMGVLEGIIGGLERDGMVESDEKKELVQDIRVIVGQAVKITQR